MVRKIILVVFTAVVLAFLYYGYTQFRRAQQPKVEVYAFVPTQASMILEMNQPFNQWEDLLSNNIIWDELNVFDQVKEVEKQIIQLDSAFRKNELTYSMFEDQNLIISMVSDTSGTQHFIFQTRYSLDQKPEEVATYLQKIFSVKISSFESEKTILKHTWNDHEFFVWVQEGVISICFNEEVLQSLIAQRAEKKSLLQNITFTNVQKTSSKDAKLKLFIHSNRLRKTLLRQLNSSAQKEVILMPQLATWTELDIDIKPDEVSLRGFSHASDSLQNWLSIFKNQESLKPLMTDFLPNRTAFLLHFGFSDFLALRKAYVKRLSEEIGSNYEHPIFEWDTAYDISVKNDFVDWIDNEVALVITEPDHSDLTNNQMVWINTSDSRAVYKHLSEMALKVTNKQEKELLVITYKDYTIQKLEIPDFLAVTLGLSFKSVTENYFTQIGDYIVFANTPYSLQWTINKLEQEKTLGNDANFAAYRNRVSSTSNVLIYSNIAASPYIYQSVASNHLFQEITEHQDWMRKFQVYSLQLSYEGNQLYYVNNYLKYNPVYKKETNSIWEVALDTTSLEKPKIVKNHYTQAPEIFIQDEANTIYRISNKGKVLWKRTLTEKIQSDVTEIDVYKNQKLQLAFNTATKMYIIDRNGKDLDGFPINLPDSASANMTVLDYEKNKDYRLVVPLANGDIVNYSTNGKPVKGWEFKKMPQAATHPVQHVRIQQKDYLVSVTKSGAIIALNRRGVPRLKINSTFNFTPKGDVKTQVGSSLSNAYVIAVTGNNEVVKISLADIKTRLFAIGMDDMKFNDFQDIDQDGSLEIIAANNAGMEIFKTDGKMIGSFATSGEMAFTPNFYHYKDGHKAGYVNTHEQRIYLIDLAGRISFGFPLKGNSPFTISDINNDGRFNVVTVDRQGILIAYTMQ